MGSEDRVWGVLELGGILDLKSRKNSDGGGELRAKPRSRGTPTLLWTTRILPWKTRLSICETPLVGLPLYNRLLE
jgi:hypothetical protein